MRTNDFVNWLSNRPAGILPNQWKACQNIMDRVSIGDLLMIILEGDDQTTLKAVKELKTRFEGYEYEVDQVMSAQSEMQYEAWN